MQKIGILACLVGLTLGGTRALGHNKPSGLTNCMTPLVKRARRTPELAVLHGALRYLNELLPGVTERDLREDVRGQVTKVLSAFAIPLTPKEFVQALKAKHFFKWDQVQKNAGDRLFNPEPDKFKPLDVQITVHLIQLVVPHAKVVSASVFNRLNPQKFEALTREQLGRSISLHHFLMSIDKHFEGAFAALEYAGYYTDDLLPREQRPLPNMSREDIIAQLRNLSEEMDLSPQDFLVNHAAVQSACRRLTKMELTAYDVWRLVKAEFSSWMGGLQSIFPERTLSSRDFERPAAWVIRIPVSAHRPQQRWEKLFKSDQMQFTDPVLFNVLAKYRRSQGTLRPTLSLREYLHQSHLSPGRLIRLSQLYAASAASEFPAPARPPRSP